MSTDDPVGCMKGTPLGTGDVVCMIQNKAYILEKRQPWVE
jgi:hypothetical protein